MRGPCTFPQISYYTPYVSASATHGTLPMTAGEKAAAKKREDERGRFGFARILDEEDSK